MSLIRKSVLHVETLYVDGDKVAAKPLKMIGAVAVIKNPWAGRGYVEDLSPEIRAIAPQLGEHLTKLILDEAGSGDAVEAFGKSAIVGLDGEIEHASALIHTLHFGNIYRTAVGAKSYLAFNNTRGPANAPLLIPMMDKNDEGRRSHYLTLQFSIPDAPAADELVIAIGAATAGRPHHRIGDRYKDLAELGNDVKNPAAVK
ncbi:MULTISPECIES: amino acid synthesis family protein [unclassified Burkholderia]|uniref:amino acid synthesis family protein n=1 Tax=unclassified Burkholderia TaxID=2613784 RepID=UPI000F5AC896|nr:MULTISPECIES: amino acid synthesis family protein [unclassified Burkholderia]RQR34520.1 amino acid synthesis family protein [Burkholderia sp. Bp9131]RQR66840.1 amino acid synthesis family protein [Burkholderia sp. Bp9015]RQR99012.1 amino acid synthesis family protein [Burkholderia sp. Bp8991]RQS21049.1 amino acid synthesis family protein [Burkholderia sp. Bp8995]RQS33457.1 amino acid synthesis family protein [Burkholderia sp. Bp8990]